jgi:hypothetical protein
MSTIIEINLDNNKEILNNDISIYKFIYNSNIINIK